MKDYELFGFLEDVFAKFTDEYTLKYGEYYGAMIYKEFIKKEIIQKSIRHDKLIKKMGGKK